MSILMIILSILFVIPNLSTNLKNYKEENKIIANSRIDETEHIGKFNQKRIEHTLVIVMTDQTELKFSASEYSKFFNELQNEKKIGKKIKYYLSNIIIVNKNPIQVEIDNKLIYNARESMKSKYLFLLLTIAFSIYSVYKLKKYLKNSDTT
jgi:hypothetical protein